MEKKNSYPRDYELSCWTRITSTVWGNRTSGAKRRSLKHNLATALACLGLKTEVENAYIDISRLVNEY
jgi:hypothetical protein